MPPVNPYTTQLLRRVRALPLAEAREFMAHLKYAETWVFLDVANVHCGADDRAILGEVRCLGREFSPAIQVRKQNELWAVNFQGMLIGTTATLSEAVDMAESELDLRGYVIPWRREVRRME